MNIWLKELALTDLYKIERVGPAPPKQKRLLNCITGISCKTSGIRLNATILKSLLEVMSIVLEVLDPFCPNGTYERLLYKLYYYNGI